MYHCILILSYVYQKSFFIQLFYTETTKEIHILALKLGSFLEGTSKQHKSQKLLYIGTQSLTLCEHDTGSKLRCIGYRNVPSKQQLWIVF